MAEEELMVVLRKSEDATFGFSLLRTDSLIGFPHVIYDIVENSPAAECGEVEAGDVIVKVNGTDVHGFTTKDVLKCLRLSTDPVTLELKRDPKIKAHVRKYLASISNQHPHSDGHVSQGSNPSSPTHHRHSPASPLSERGPSRIQPTLIAPGGNTPGRYGHRVSSSDPSCRPSRIPQAVQAKNSWSAPQSPHGIKPPRPSMIPTVNGGTPQGHHQQQQHQYSATTNSSSPFFRQEHQQNNPFQQQQVPKKGFEAFMMTGDLILNLSRTPQSSGILPQAKKIDSLRDSPSHRASTKRKNGAIAPHAKCDSSPSSPSSSSNSYSEHHDNNSSTNSKQRSLPKDHSSKKSRSQQQQEEDQQDQNTDQNTGSSIESIVNSSSKKLSASGGSNHNNNHTNNNRFMEEDERALVNSSKHSSSEAAGGNTTGRTIGSNSNSAGSSVDAADEEEENADDLIDLRSNRTNTSGCVSSSLLGERNSARRDVRPGGQDGSNISVTVQPGTNSVGSDSVDSSSSAAATNGDLRHYHSKERSKSSSSAASSGGGTTVKSESSPEMSYSVPTSPTSLSAAPILEGYASSLKKKDLLLANSVPTSPESGAQEIVRRSSSSGNHHHQPHHHHHHHHHQHQQYHHHSSNNQSSNSGNGGPVGHSSSLMSASISGVGGGGGGGGSAGSSGGGGVVRKCDAAGFRTSRSEDHLQQTQREGGIGALVPIEIDEDVNSSLNTLLDTRHDSEESQGSDHDRIVWTYNAPVSQQTNGAGAAGPAAGIITSPISHSSSMSSSPQRSASDSPASPTSVSSSVMSSSGGSKGANDHTHNGYSNSGFDGGRGGTHSNLQSLSCPNGSGPGGGGGMDQSVSEAVSNISSPDYQDEHDLLSTRDLAAMAISDPSDSDSTILVSETTHRVHDRDRDRDHKIVIQVKGMQQQQQHQSYSQQQLDSEDELAALADDTPTMFFGQDGQLMYGGGRESSPPVSDDGSDVDSLHSFHYSPKAVDLPSAERLAKRLYYLEGFKKSDVSRHLSKNNDFSRAVADEYLKFFLFERLTLDEALRLFLKQFSLSGETQERERVLVHFSKRYLDCNPGSFNSQDAVHTLTCAIMLLNTDLHGQNIGRKMTCSEFIENLSELNDGENFPKDILKQLYQAIKTQPLEWALDDESPDQQKLGGGRNDGTMGGNGGGGTGGSLQGPPVGPNPFLDPPQPAAIEYKKGYVMRKCCYDTNYKKTPFGKRSWKMFYCTLRDLVLYLHKDEHGFRKNQMSDNVHNAIRIHHALATKASDYTKKQHVFRLQTADQSEYLFQTSDSKELQSWIDTINFVCASFSAPPLEGGVGSQKRFQRPLLPCTHTKLLLREQLASHEEQVNKLDNLLAEHKRSTIPTKGLALQNYKEKEAYLLYELKRYKTYYYLLSSRMNSDQSLDFENLLTLGDSGVLLESDEILQRNRQNTEGGGFESAGANQTIIQQQPLGQQQQQQLQQSQLVGGLANVTTAVPATTGSSASNRSDSRQYKT